MGPFTIQSLLGDNAVSLNLTDRFRLLNPRVNIAYLRPYRLRTSDIGPPPARLSAKPVSVEPDGSGWYQIEEILDHRGSAGPNGECLVRWKDFDASHDSWIRRHSVTPLALRSYEEFLTAHAEASKRLADRTHHKSDMTRAPCSLILSLQPLLQSLQHQRRLMLRKTLPLRRLRLLLLFLLRDGCFVDPSIIRIQDDRHIFFFLVVRNLSHCFCFFLVFNLVQGPLGPRTFVFLFLSLPFSWYSCRDVYESGGG